MICPFCNIFCEDVDEFRDVCRMGYRGFTSEFKVDTEKVVRALRDCENPLFCFSSLDVIDLAKKMGYNTCKPYATCKLDDLKGRNVVCYNYDPTVENPRLLSRFFRIGMDKLVYVGKSSKIALEFESLEEAIEKVEDAVVLSKVILEEEYLENVLDVCKDFGVDLIFTSFIPKDFDFDLVLTSQSVEFKRVLRFGLDGDVKCFDVGRVLRMDGVEMEVKAEVPSTYDLFKEILIF